MEAAHRPQTHPLGGGVLAKLCLRLAKHVAGNDGCLTFVSAALAGFCFGAESAARPALPGPLPDRLDRKCRMDWLLFGKFLIKL